MQKNKIVLLAIGMALLLTACQAAGAPVTTTVTVTKEGKIISNIVEDFTSVHYTETNLRQMAEDEVTEYNTAAGAEAVVIDQLEITGSTVRLDMRFATAKDYEAFNDVIFFYGTIDEAYKAGYQLDINLFSTDDSQDQINKMDIMQMGDTHIIITEEPIHICTEGAIAYISNNIALVDKKEVNVIIPGDSEDLAYIILKK